MRMLEVLKEMQKRGIFKIMSCDIDLDNLIKDANDFNDLNSVYNEIVDYIRQLHLQFGSYSNIPINDTLSDFCDKFHYEMFDIYYNKDHISKEIYEKKITFGGAGDGKLGLSSDDVRFKLEELKLLKLINHAYIKLKQNDSFQNEYIYIPFELLRTMFVIDSNNKEIKDSIIDTCTRINEKKIFWDLSKTRYVKKLNDNKLATVKNDSLVDITILYLPREHKKGINGETYTIKGIVCKITKFMEMRYMLRQISNLFPSPCLRAKYLEFSIADNLTYHLNLLIASNSKHIKTISNKKIKATANKSIQNHIKNNYTVSLFDLATNIRSYNNGQLAKSYYMKITEDTSKAKRHLENLFNAIASVSLTLKHSDKMKYNSTLMVGNKVINLYDNKKDVAKSGKDIYTEVLNSICRDAVRGKVLSHFNEGEIKLKISL